VPNQTPTVNPGVPTQVPSPEEQYRQNAIAAMQQNPMAYLALTTQQPGSGLQLRPMPAKAPPTPQAHSVQPKHPAVARQEALQAYQKAIMDAQTLQAQPAAPAPTVARPRGMPVPTVQPDAGAALLAQASQAAKIK